MFVYYFHYHRKNQCIIWNTAQCKVKLKPILPWRISSSNDGITNENDVVRLKKVLTTDAQHKERRKEIIEERKKNTW